RVDRLPDDKARATLPEPERVAQRTEITMRLVLSFALMLSVPLGAHAQTARVDRVDVFEYGIYQAEKTKQTDAGVVAGHLNTVENIQNKEVTRNVPARSGVRFGFRYKVIGEPDGAQVSMTVVHKFPKQGLRRPGTAETVYREEYVTTKMIGKESYTGYHFE